MPLQTSGAISLNQIHVEAGGSSGTQCSINDSDIRALINKASGATSSFSNFYGASSSILSTTMSVGSYIVSGDYGSSNYGFQLASSPVFSGQSWGSMGSRSVNGIQSGANIIHLAYNSIVGIRLIVDDNSTVSNSGFTTLRIGSTNLSRTSAGFSNQANTQSGSQGYCGIWTWSSTNLFGTSGTKSILIT